MIPVRDSRLLPGSSAENATNLFLYRGTLEGLRVPRAIHTLADPNARMAYRIPITRPDVDFIDQSYWLEFDNADTSVVKSPVLNATDQLFYWASSSGAPGYNSKARIAAGSPALVLGVPAPVAAPTVTTSGGSSATLETRAYVYTWVTTFGEEGPPSPATVQTGKIDATWNITLTAPGTGATTGRLLNTVRIYRTITNAQGVATYYFVAEQPIATTTYADTITDTIVAGQTTLDSTSWTAPPSDLEGIVAMANGMLVGWRGQEVWFCEPFRPHAWPAAYTINMDYDVVGMAAIQQTCIVGTEGGAHALTGITPDAITDQRIAGSEPCASRGSFAVIPAGVYYASFNGLILVANGGATNVTAPYIGKDDWQNLLVLSNLRAGILNGAYFAFTGVQDGFVQTDTFQTNAFQQTDYAGTRDGAMLDVLGNSPAITRTQSVDPNYNVFQDPWTNELLMIRDGQVLFEDLTYDTYQSYVWRSKIFELATLDNMGVVQVIYDQPAQVSDPPGANLKTYADGVLVQNKVLPPSGQMWRLPSGFKARNYQFELTGNIVCHSIEVASTVTELRAPDAG